MHYAGTIVSIVLKGCGIGHVSIMRVVKFCLRPFLQPPPVEEQEDEEEGFDEEIYDCVPDELKEQIQGEEEGEEPDDIYDIPPGEYKL